jgi:Protein of unknown function (DUF1501)
VKSQGGATLSHPRLLNRRQLLQVGGISVLGLGLPELLQAGRSSSRRSDKSCIFIFQYGGPPQLDTFDPKPDAPDGIRSPFNPIATAVPGVQICELLPRLAKLSNRYCLLRSLTHDKTGHDEGTHVMCTGQSRPSLTTPYFGSLMARVRPSERRVPSYVWLAGLAGDVKPQYLTGGFLGAAYSPFHVGPRYPASSPQPDYQVSGLDATQSEQIARRFELLGKIESGSHPQSEAKDLRHFQQLAADMVSSPATRQAFDLEQEPAALRERYGRQQPLGQYLLLARKLVEAGVRLISVVAWCGSPPGKSSAFTQTWDMHGDSGSIFGTDNYRGLGWVLPQLDQAVSALLEDLEQRGLLDTTLVVLVGEFGRTPRISKSPSPGRDHWAACYSGLLAGAGIRGGMVYGASDKYAAYVKEKPVSPEDFGATLFHALGVPPETEVREADGRPHPVSRGQALVELF